MTTFGLTCHNCRSIKKFIYTSSQVVYGDPNSLSVDESYPVDSSYSAYATSKQILRTGSITIRPEPIICRIVLDYLVSLMAVVL